MMLEDVPIPRSSAQDAGQHWDDAREEALDRDMKIVFAIVGVLVAAVLLVTW